MDIDRRQLVIAAGTGAAAAWLAVGRAAEAAAAPTAPPAPTSQTAGLEEQLASYAAGVRYQALPTPVVEACKRALLDALACACGALSTPPARIAAATFQQAFGSNGVATVIGAARRIATEGAVLINGTLIRQLDLNDVYFGKDPSHPSEITAVALACCEEAGRSGRDLIESLVVGYETEVRLNDAISWAAHGLIASSAAAFIAPLVVGKAWRMPAEQVVHAMGISGPRQLTLLAVNSGEISMMKSVGPGYTAMDAVFSTRLAVAGMTGVTRGLEWMLSNIPPKQERVSVDLDPGHYQLTRVGMKRFPLQGELQAVAEAGTNLHAKVAGRIAAIQEISVQAYPGTLARGVAEPEKFHPVSRETADHSLPICLAIALLEGDVTVKQYDQGRWKAPDVLALAQKVKVSSSPQLVAQRPDGHGTIVTLRLEGGQTLSEAVLVAQGDATRPMSRAAMEHKFRQFADPVLGESAARQVVRFVDDLEQLEDVRSLTALLEARS